MDLMSGAAVLSTPTPQPASSPASSQPAFNPEQQAKFNTLRNALTADLQHVATGAGSIQHDASTQTTAATDLRRALDNLKTSCPEALTAVDRFGKSVLDHLVELREQAPGANAISHNPFRDVLLRLADPSGGTGRPEMESPLAPRGRADARRDRAEHG